MPENADAGTENNGAGTDGAGAAATKVSELPQWAQDELSRARSDAASYRARLKDAKSEVETEVRKEYDGKLTEATNKNTTLQNELTDSKLFGLKIDVAIDAGVPGESLKTFADRLRGNTIDEIKADAEAVVKAFGVGAPAGRAIDRSAGLGNTQTSSPEDALGDFVNNRLGWNK